MNFKTAKLIFEGFHGYKANFDSITKNARIRFENKQWPELQSDIAYRLYLHKNFVHATVEVIQEKLKGIELCIQKWEDVYNEYYSLVSSRLDIELALTFFSSVTRKILPTYFHEGYHPITVFKAIGDPAMICNVLSSFGNLKEDVVFLLENISLDGPYPTLIEDAHLISQRLNLVITQKGFALYKNIVISKSLFYRNRTAYLAAKITLTDECTVPFLIALVNRTNGIQAEAVIATSEEIEVIFSFTRAYFLVDTPSPSGLVSFLQTLMPQKRQAEIYNSLGFNKHGKTLLFHDLHQYISTSNEKLEIAPGIRGMVMIVFTFPSFHTVFKIIKDEFDPVKTVTRKEVLEKYRLVYKHDRYGRLADTHEFDSLVLSTDYFVPELLEELLAVASRTIKVQGKKVLIKHTFTERKMHPLNLFIEENELDVVAKVIIDYGNALKELAYANIFPGDLLMKNFGVTRDQRVVFYDYDEITFVTSCNFRQIPIPQTIEELYAFQPNYEVKANDIFPEEFKNYLVPQGPLRDIFVEAHPELFEVSFWEKVKQKHLEGFPYEINSYDKKNCLRNQ